MIQRKNLKFEFGWGFNGLIEDFIPKKVILGYKEKETRLIGLASRNVILGYNFL